MIKDRLQHYCPETKEYYLVDTTNNNILKRRKKKFDDVKQGVNAMCGESPIHDWFELSHAQYLTIPRSVLQSMPIDWQRRFVKCLKQLDDKIDWRPDEATYWCLLRDNKTGRYIGNDPLADYDRGRRIIPFRKDK
jgi:hypothetical protein